MSKYMQDAQHNAWYMLRSGISIILAAWFSGPSDLTHLWLKLLIPLGVMMLSVVVSIW